MDQSEQSGSEYLHLINTPSRHDLITNRIIKKIAREINHATFTHFKLYTPIVIYCLLHESIELLF